MPQQTTLIPSRIPPAWWIIGIPVAALFAVTGALWVHYGTAVFVEMIVAGIASCL